MLCLISSTPIRKRIQRIRFRASVRDRLDFMAVAPVLAPGVGVEKAVRSPLILFRGFAPEGRSRAARGGEYALEASPGSHQFNNTTKRTHREKDDTASRARCPQRVDHHRHCTERAGAGGRQGEVRLHGTIDINLHALEDGV